MTEQEYREAERAERLKYDPTISNVAAHASDANRVRRKTQLFIEKLAMSKAGDLIEKVLAQALDGCLPSQKLILDRIYPIPKTATYVSSQAIKDLKTQDNVNVALTNIITQIGAGELSIEDAAQIVAMIEKKSQSIQVCMNEELESIRGRMNELEVDRA